MSRTNWDVHALFRDQHGVIHRSQLLALGVTDRQIFGQLQVAAWERVHPGVYRSVPTPVTFEQALMAACLAAGPLAVASHAAAVWLWGLSDRPPDRPVLTVPAPAHPRLRGVDVHRLNDLDPGAVRYRRSIPCTDPVRALVDLAAVAGKQELTSSVNRALSTGLVPAATMRAELDRRARQGRRGVRALRSLLHERGVLGAPDASALEIEAMLLLHRFQIAVYGREVRTEPDGRYRIDIALTPPVALEVDGYAYHWSPEAKAHDERRRTALRLAGTFLLVYTWRDIRYDPHRVAREVRAAIARYAAA
ncbi:MAG: hypothetical protein ACRDYY_03885 [Acidimicrobiales bacterium]